MSTHRVLVHLAACALVTLVACNESQPRETAPASRDASSPFASARYELGRRGAASNWFAIHPRMGFESEFSRDLAAVRPAQLEATAASLNLRAVAWGCGESSSELPAVDPEGVPGEPTQVRYRHASGRLIEWYRHTPDGLEQGFDVSELPPCARREKRLLIRLTASRGWTSAVSVDHSRAAFRHTSGAVVNYSEAHARSAAGQHHPVHVVQLADAVALEVELDNVVLPLVIDPLAWTEQQKLTASDGANDDAFGSSLALNGAQLVVGAPRDDDKGTDSGSVYAFTRSGASWGSQQKLVASDGAAGDEFGCSVASSDNYLAVGAFNDDDGFSDAGSTYVYTRSANSWGAPKKLLAGDPAAGNQFGVSVALDGTTLVVGANYDSDLGTHSGSAYVFSLVGGTWTFQQKLLADDADPDAGDVLGTSVAVSGDTAVVGAPLDSQGASGAGAAFVFVRSGTTWTQQAKLVASDAAADQSAGSAVSISGNTIAVGAYGDGEKASYAGAVYVWTRSGATWSKQAKLFAKAPAAGNYFGVGVAARGDNLVIGSSGLASATGAAYVFQRSGSAWSEITRLQASDAATNASFGGSVSLDGNDVAVSAPAMTNNKGAAYVAALADNSPCAADADCKSAHCVEGVCCNSACNATCQTCLASRKASGADGVCGNVKTDTDPQDDCATTQTSSCGTTGVCNGAGACALWTGGTECAAAACSGASSVNPKDTCSGSGVCQTTSVQSCVSGYLCEAGACHDSCTAANEAQACATARGFKCLEGACKIPQGDACTADADCQTGHCADGVCCNTACDHECTACTTALKGSGDDGVCEPVSANTNPRQECTTDGSDCGADGQCDGEGNCRSFAPPTKSCENDVTCSDGVVKGHLCDGAGVCKTSQANCAPFLCDTNECAESCRRDDECARVDALPDYAGAFCNGAMRCEDKHADGTSCLAEHECASGHCVDGYCCNSACEGQCEACAEPKSEGKCIPVKDAPRGARAACDSAPDGEPCQEVSCDGVERKSCAGFVGSKVVCEEASCVDGRATGTRRCDGNGACATPVRKACDPYACGATDCLLECQTNDDCVDGNTCIQNECRTGSRCNDEGTGVIDSMGTETSCGAYLCKADQCVTKCVTSTDCAGAFLCAADTGSCVEAATTGSGDDSGCGCRIVQADPTRRLGWAMLGAAALLARRRSGQRRRPSRSPRQT